MLSLKIETLDGETDMLTPSVRAGFFTLMLGFFTSNVYGNGCDPNLHQAPPPPTRYDKLLSPDTTMQALNTLLFKDHRPWPTKFKQILTLIANTNLDSECHTKVYHLINSQDFLYDQNIGKIFFNDFRRFLQDEDNFELTLKEFSFENIISKIDKIYDPFLRQFYEIMLNIYQKIDSNLKFNLEKTIIAPRMTIYSNPFVWLLLSQA